jgi:hypothetical protein
MPTPKETEHGRRQLRRLEVLTDVIFAIAIWRIFMMLPRPGGGERSGDRQARQGVGRGKVA